MLSSEAEHNSIASLYLQESSGVEVSFLKLDALAELTMLNWNKARVILKPSLLTTLQCYR